MIKIKLSFMFSIIPGNIPISAFSHLSYSYYRGLQLTAASLLESRGVNCRLYSSLTETVDIFHIETEFQLD